MLLLSVAFLILAVRRFEKLSNEVLFWSALIVVSQILGYTIGISTTSACLVLIIAIASRWIFGKWESRRMMLFQYLLAIPFLLTASMPTRFLDAGRYYNQTVRWFIHGIPKGLANFDLYLLQGSAAHSTEALLTSITTVGYDSLVPLLSTLLIVRSIVQWRITTPKLLALLIFYAVFVHFAQTSSPDLLAVAIVIASLSALRTHSSAILLATVAAVLPLIKLTFIPISLFFIWELLRGKNYKEMTIVFAAGILALGKLVWVAGWIPLIGTLPVDWHISHESIELLSSASIGESSGNRGAYILEGYKWRYLDVFTYLVYISLIFLFKRGNSKRRFTLHLVIALVGLFFVPQARFVIPLIIFLLLQVEMSQSRFNISKWKSGAVVLSIGLISVMPHWRPYISNERFGHFFDFGGIQNVSWITPTPNWKISTVRGTDEQVEFPYYVPNEDFECFDGEFPCRREVE